MKEEKILKQFDDLLKHSKDSNINHLEDTVHELIRIFMEIKDQLESDDIEVRKKAINNLNILQKKLKEQADQAVKETGLSKTELNEYLSTPENFTDEEWLTIQNAQKELKDYEKELIKPSHHDHSHKKESDKEHGKKKRPPKDKWISG
jgi:hypothetical protein